MMSQSKSRSHRPIRRERDATSGGGGMQRGRLAAILLALILIGAFAIRTIRVAKTVLPGQEVVFLESDPWYHVRLVENLVANFPHLNQFDPYGQYPDGQSLPVAPLFDWIMAAASLVIGLGRPSARTIELVCAFTPPVLGTLAVLVTYAIGRRLFGRAAGLLAAAVQAIMPSNFLAFSLLGYTDHHVAEVLFSSLVILGLVGSMHKRSPANPDWIARHGPALLAGLAMSAYTLNWVGAAMFIGIVATWFIVQVTIEHLRGADTRPFVPFALMVFGIPLLFAAWATLSGFALREGCVALAGSLIAVMAVCFASNLTSRMAAGRRAFLVVIIVLGVACPIAAALLVPGAWDGIIGQMSRFNVRGGALQLVETTPLLHGPDGWTFARAYDQFTTCFFLAVAAIPILAWRIFRDPTPGRTLLMIWSIAMILATLGQSRFAYYSAGTIALLAAWLALEIAMSIDRHVKAPLAARTAKSFFAIIVVGLWIAPSIPAAWDLAEQADAPNPDWREALAWMRANTPEPFGNAAEYLARYDVPPTGQRFNFPPTAYSVMNWWDYGYWIIRAGRRIPASNPTQHAASEVARFFLSQDEAAAARWMQQFGSRYVILDALMGFLPSRSRSAAGGKFTSLVAWAGERSETYLESCYERTEAGAIQPLTLFYPACHMSLYARLFIFRGQRVEPTEVFAARIEQKEDPGLGSFRLITDCRRFTNHAAADAFVKQNEGYRIASRSPFSSCVPLEAIRDFRLIHQSPTLIGAQSGHPIAYVEIYEYLRSAMMKPPAGAAAK